MIFPFFSRTKIFLPALVAVSLPGVTAHAQTGVLDKRSARFVSGPGNIAFLALGTIALPLLRDGSDRKNHTLRSLDALGTSVLLSEGLKALTREERPDGSGERNSFPSGHATAAFAVATMQARYHPREAPLWYAGAFFIADSRVTLRRHFAHDVIAGALLGTGVSFGELSTPRGLILSPFIKRGEHGSAMIGVSGRF